MSKPLADLPIIPSSLFPCHLVTLSPCHLVTLSPCHLVTLSPCHLVTLSPCHLVTLSPCHLVTCSTKVLESGIDLLPHLGHHVEPVLLPGVHGHTGRGTDSQGIALG